MPVCVFETQLLHWINVAVFMKQIHASVSRCMDLHYMRCAAQQIPLLMWYQMRLSKLCSDLSTTTNVLQNQAKPLQYVMHHRPSLVALMSCNL